MKEARVFIVARVQEKDYAKLVLNSAMTPDEIEQEGTRFGQWLLDNASTSLLKGLHQLFDEAEITKKSVWVIKELALCP
jgi:hypothetical protein